MSFPTSHESDVISHNAAYSVFLLGYAMASIIVTSP